MRILMLSEFYPPIIGGMERHVQTLSREISGRHVPAGRSRGAFTARVAGSSNGCDAAAVEWWPIFRVAAPDTKAVTSTRRVFQLCDSSPRQAKIILMCEAAVSDHIGYYGTSNRLVSSATRDRS